MSDSRGRNTTDPLILRGESSLLITAAEIAERIENFVSTPEGTLHSVVGPLPFVPKSEGRTVAFPSEYGVMHGIYHMVTNGGSTDILLLHTGEYVYHFQGWDTASPWKKVLGSANTPLKVDLPSGSAPQFPTQFETTPKGVVIVPQSSERAIFYTGEPPRPLGYSTIPSSPTGYGPETSDPTDKDKVNDSGYAVSRAAAGYTLHSDFGFGRLGTVDPRPDSSIGGRLLSGTYQCAYQWIDFYGNLSPLSPRSNAASFIEQEVAAVEDSIDMLRKQVLWSNISPGPEGTMGRVLSRTRDAQNSGTQKLFIVPGNTGYGSFGAFATIPDNTATKWPDNVPDGWIVAEPHDVMPVPAFKLCRLAFGRLWIANTTDDPGILIPSMPGRYGTFLTDSEMFPDPSGGEITGLWSTQGGMLVFTATSTFLLAQTDDGQDFQFVTLNANIGCVAPSSIVNMPDGTVFWLGREGFYAFDGTQISSISGHIRREMDRINPVRARQACAAVDVRTHEYRCWVPLDASRKNNMCFVFDGIAWRRRSKESLQAVCTTKDHRKYMIGAGDVVNDSGSTDTGVWVLDRSVGNYTPQAVTATIETAWITWNESISRRSGKTIYLALRETHSGSATIKVYRDWRKSSTPIYADSSNATLHSPEDLPPFWGTATWDAQEWVRRRPYWKRVDIHIPSCEVFKIVIEASTPIEFIGLSIDTEPKLGGFGTRVP